jgi:hypothetical protein
VSDYNWAGVERAEVGVAEVGVGDVVSGAVSSARVSGQYLVGLGAVQYLENRSITSKGDGCCRVSRNYLGQDFDAAAQIPINFRYSFRFKMTNASTSTSKAARRQEKTCI